MAYFLCQVLYHQTLDLMLNYIALNLSKNPPCFFHPLIFLLMIMTNKIMNK